MAHFVYCRFVDLSVSTLKYSHHLQFISCVQNLITCIHYSWRSGERQLHVRICNSWVRILLGLLWFLLSPTFLKHIFGQILKILKILNQWRLFGYNIISPMLISTGAPDHLSYKENKLDTCRILKLKRAWSIYIIWLHYISKIYFQRVWHTCNRWWYVLHL